MKKNKKQLKISLPKLSMSESKKRKLQKYIDKLMKKGVKDKGRAKYASMVKNHGKIIKGKRWAVLLADTMTQKAQHFLELVGILNN